MSLLTYETTGLLVMSCVVSEPTYFLLYKDLRQALSSPVHASAGLLVVAICTALVHTFSMGPSHEETKAQLNSPSHSDCMAMVEWTFSIHGVLSLRSSDRGKSCCCAVSWEDSRVFAAVQPQDS